jgi:rubredoxin
MIMEVRPNSIVVLDNVEYSANWGRLDRSSAKPNLIETYRCILRSIDWHNYIFEQSEGREGHGSTDKTGWESPHRWLSAVCWPKEHFFHELMITHLGFPVVNRFGMSNDDIKSLEERCPFDWSTMEWLREPFPKELDLKLDRDFS